MKKKIIGAFCVLALCLVLLPATAHAAEHEHPVCGAACDGDCGGGHSSATWQPFSTEAWNDMENGKEYWFYLTKDVTVTDILRIGNNTTVHLCLNGHILDGSQSESGIIFYVGSLSPYLTSGNLTLCDCQTTRHTGHIGNETHLWTQGAGSSADTPCNLTGGVITGAKKNCVYVHSGTLTMYGGNLAGNTASSGGAISLGRIESSFTMYGGSITGNTATNGGGIAATGTVNINGGSISNNSATNRGGGVYVIGGTCNITGTTSISNNSATNGGGVYVNSGTCNINSGSISSNTATDGGGVYVGGGICTIRGGSISSNNATFYGGGVYASSSTLTLQANSNVSQNKAYYQGGGIYADNTIFTMSANSTVSGNSALNNGGGIALINSPANSEMSGGTVLNNEVTVVGGGIWVSSGSFTISGGTISNNQTSLTATSSVPPSGGGVAVDNEAQLTLTGGTITENTSVRGGGVYINQEPLKLSGEPKIINNTGSAGSNLYLRNQTSPTAIIQLSDKLGINANINFTTQKPGIFVENWNEHMPNQAPATYFSTGNTGYHIGVNADGAATLFANTYTVVFNPGVGEGSMNPQAFTYDDEEKPLTANSFTKTGYTFAGWSDGGGNTYTDGQKVKNLTAVNNGSVTLTAQWRANVYTVTLNTNGGTINSGNVTSYTYGVGAALPTGVTRSGYTFDGWYDNENCTGTPVTKITATDLGNKAFWAKWTPNSYTVTFASNGGDGSMNSQSFTYDDVAQKLSKNNFAKTGYTFAGWIGSDSMTYADEQEVKNLTAEPGGIVTLTAQWKANSYTVHFECNGGDGGSMSDQAFTYDAERNLTPNGFTKTGHSFAGWSTTPDGSVVYTDNQAAKNLTAVKDGTVTLYAQWTANTYTVTLYPNEGKIEGSTPDSGGNYVIHYTYGVSITLPTEKEIVRSGYRFGGWYDNKELEGEPVTEIRSADLGNKEFWAKWDYISSTPTYSVILPDNVAGGEITAVKRYAQKGETFRFTVTADEGYELSTLTVTDSKGSELALTDEGSGVWSFKMPASKVTVEAVFAPISLPFTDVPENAWYYDAVWYTYTHGLMNGTSGTTFAPHGTMTRAMLVTILWRQAGEPVVNYLIPFTDVTQGTWYSEAVRWASSEGIVTGMSATAFAPNEPITREQFAAILYRYAQKTGADVSVGEDTNILSYADALEVSEYAVPAMQWACGAGVIQGSGANLNPKDGATRAEAAAMLMRFDGLNK